MFSRPYHHVPLFPKTPAGYRIFTNPKPCFRPFTFSRNPDQPLNVDPLFDYNAPPTQGLPQIFGSTTKHADRTSKKFSPLIHSKVHKKTPSFITSRRKHGPKRFTYHLSATRPSLRRKGPRFRTPAHIKRENAAAALDRLEDIACETMQTDHMTRDDCIFLKQLEGLRLDQHRKNKLGDARDCLERAGALAPRRVLEHAERDRQAAVRVEENARRKKDEEEFRRLQELRRKEEECRRENEKKRREEESRRRAVERARLRERELQAKREAFRKAQEAAERHAREQAAQRIQEEAERQERLREEQLRQNATQAGVVAYLQLYDAKWEELKRSKILTSVMLCEMPWPIIGQGCISPDDISQRGMEEFIFHPLRTGMETKSRKDRLKIEMLRFHPDKFNSHIVNKLRECDREKATEIAGAVARILTNMMTKEIQRERASE